MILIQNSAYLDFLSTLAIEGAHPGGIKLTKELFKKEDINDTSQVLDVGCGTGQTAAYLAYKYGANVTGIDINPTMVARAKRRMKKNNLPVEIIQGSVEKIPLPDNYFDFIISESVLSFVNKPTALKEIYRLLKNGGRFVAIEQTIIQPLTDEDAGEIKQFYGFDSLPMKEDWMELLKNAGFEQMRIQKNTSINSIPDFHSFNNIEPKLKEIMEKHFDIITKHADNISYRVYSCTK